MTDQPQQPEQTEAQALDDRRAKLARLREQGIEPFPHEFPDVVRIEEVHLAHGDLEAGQETESSYRVAGRLSARRGHGKAAFLDVVDRSGRIQVHARLDVLGPERFEQLVSLDLGDLVGIDGTAFTSRRGELSLRVDGWTLLAKSLRPPPDKFHGLEDVETRYRQRELDLLANEESRQLFLLRSLAISAIRRHLDDRGFIEVETPVLQPLYGGAMARPFTTHHNALDRDFYLRIATELYLKRLIVGGLERVYELGKDFRNEGISHKHNPEFTMLEWYEAYGDYETGAQRLEELVTDVVDVCGAEAPGIDWSRPWKRVKLRDAVLENTGVDVLASRDVQALVAAAEERGIELDPGDTWPQLVDELLSKHVEPKLVNPTFVMDYPVELSPFAKRHRTEEGLVERWECFAGGIEISNAFSELNDPDDQRARFEEQQRFGAEGDDEAQPYDEDYVRALEYGMPPTSGVGLGIDRLVMLMAGRSTLREVILFPAMRN